MVMALDEIGCVADAEIVRRVQLLVGADRRVGAKLLLHLGELQERRLYVGQGYSSMFEYCRRALGMSDAEAYLRLQAAAIGRRFPLVLERFAAGDLHLTGIKMLARYLTDENHAQLLERVRGMTKSEILVVLAEVSPKEDVPARVRRLPVPRAAREEQLSVLQPIAAEAAAGSFALEAPRVVAATTPLRPGRFKLELTLGAEAHSKLEQLRALLRHQYPSGDLAQVVERAISELLAREMKRRFGQTDSPRECVAKRVSVKSRYVPRQVLREVHARDAGQCTFVSADGHRCAERGFLEVHHHDVPFARGGASTAENLRLVCRAHNLFFAEQVYGRGFVRRKVRDAAAQRLVPDRRSQARSGGGLEVFAAS